MVRSSLLVVFAILLVFIATPTKNIPAIVEVWSYVESHSKVFINFSSPYDYYTRDIPFRYIHEADGLNFVRQDLVNQGKIQDLPILISLPFSSLDPAQVSLEKNGLLRQNEADEKPLGECYKIHVVGKPTYGDLATLVAALQHLKEKKQKIEILSLEKLKGELSQDLARYQNIVQHFDPIWSPNGRFLLYTVWSDGEVFFELFDAKSKTTLRLEPLNDYMVVRPVWSGNSRYIAYASLNEVKVFDVTKKNTQTVALTSLLEGGRLETLISFDVSKGKLLFAADTNGLTSYHIYSYALRKQTVTPVTLDASRPEWGGDFIPTDQYQYSARMSVSSPKGKHLALLEEADGLKQISVKAVEGKPRDTFRKVFALTAAGVVALVVGAIVLQ